MFLLSVNTGQVDAEDCFVEDLCYEPAHESGTARIHCCVYLLVLDIVQCLLCIPTASTGSLHSVVEL
jgi:hypothetical protein